MIYGNLYHTVVRIVHWRIAALLVLCCVLPLSVSAQESGTEPAPMYRLFRLPTACMATENKLVVESALIVPNEPPGSGGVFTSLGAGLIGRSAMLRLGVRDFRTGKAGVPMFFELLFNVLDAQMFDLGVGTSLSLLNTDFGTSKNGAAAFSFYANGTFHYEDYFGITALGGITLGEDGVALGAGAWVHLFGPFAAIAEGQAMGSGSGGGTGWAFGGLRYRTRPFVVDLGYGQLYKYPGTMLSVGLIP